MGFSCSILSVLFQHFAMARDPVHWLATNFRLMNKRLELLEAAIKQPSVKTEYIVVERPSNNQKPSVDERSSSIQKPVNQKKKMKTDELPASIQHPVYQKKFVGELESPQTHVQNSLQKSISHKTSEPIASRVASMEMPKFVNIPVETPDELLAALSPFEKHDKQGMPISKCVSKDDSVATAVVTASSATSVYDASYLTQSRFSTASTTASDFAPPEFPSASVHLEADAVELSGISDRPADYCTTALQHFGTKEDFDALVASYVNALDIDSITSRYASDIDACVARVTAASDTDISSTKYDID